LGEPSVVRRDQASEIWQYRGNGCILDLYLFAEGGHYRLAYLEARDFYAASFAADHCLKELVAVRQAALPQI
jgi:hypothetical protein